MTIEIDHILVPSRDKVAAATLLARLLGVPWAESTIGPFAAVFVNDGFTIDFDTWADPVTPIHYCFRVSQEEFDATLDRLRAAGIAFRSTVNGPVNFKVDTGHGGSIVYWNEPDGHRWEMLTVSYARKA